MKVSLPLDLMNTNLIVVAKLAGIGAGLLGFILVLYSLIFPLKMKALILPFPLFRGWFFKLFYNIFFLLLYGVALPAGEMAYYVVFLRELVPEDNKVIEALFISGFYALMNWCGVVFIFKGFFSQIFVTALAFGIMFGIIHLVNTRNLTPLTVTVRYILAWAILIWLIYLAMTRKGWLGRSTPDYYYNGNVKNIWRRGG